MAVIADVLKADMGSPTFRTLASVVAPGVLVLGEVYAVLEDVPAVEAAVAEFPKQGFAAAAIAFITFLVIAFVIGFVGRRVVFNRLDPTARETVASVREFLVGQLGQDLWDHAFKDHAHVLASLRDRKGSGFWLFQFCKDWLRVNCPGMAGLERETEVNVFASLVWPALLAPAAVVGLLDLRDSWAVAGAVAAAVSGLGLAWGNARFVRQMFDNDIRDGVRSFILVKAQTQPAG